MRQKRFKIETERGYTIGDNITFQNLTPAIVVCRELHNKVVLSESVSQKRNSLRGLLSALSGGNVVK